MTTIDSNINRICCEKQRRVSRLAHLVLSYDVIIKYYMHVKSQIIFYNDHITNHYYKEIKNKDHISYMSLS